MWASKIETLTSVKGEAIFDILADTIAVMKPGHLATNWPM